MGFFVQIGTIQSNKLVRKKNWQNVVHNKCSCGVASLQLGQSQAGLVEGIFRCKVILEYSGRTVLFCLTLYEIDCKV